MDTDCRDFDKSKSSNNNHLDSINESLNHYTLSRAECKMRAKIIEKSSKIAAASKNLQAFHKGRFSMLFTI